MSGLRTRRSRRVNESEEEDEEFKYQDGDLTTVETGEGLDVSTFKILSRSSNYRFFFLVSWNFEFGC